jgi:hypothetical protein
MGSRFYKEIYGKKCTRYTPLGVVFGGNVWI